VVVLARNTSRPKALITDLLIALLASNAVVENVSMRSVSG